MKINKQESKVYIHAVLLIIVTTLGFLFAKTGLINYQLQIFALLFMILIGLKQLKQAPSNLIDSIIITFVIVALINSNGGVNSPFFFLIYFLLFSLSLYLEPIITVILSVCLFIFFAFSLSSDAGLAGLIPLSSLPMMTPFALFMGEEYIKLQKSRKKTAETTEQTDLFLSLILKNHVHNIRELAENFLGDHELSQIKKQAEKMEQLIDDYEKNL